MIVVAVVMFLLGGWSFLASHCGHVSQRRRRTDSFKLWEWRFLVINAGWHTGHVATVSFPFSPGCLTSLSTQHHHGVRYPTSFEQRYLAIRPSVAGHLAGCASLPMSSIASRRQCGRSVSLLLIHMYHSGTSRQDAAEGVWVCS